MTEASPAARVGRPRRSSRQMLEDAAAELFLEQGYPATSIEQITQRAGVSRNTFFNYFGAKSDLLWIDLDPSITALVTALGASGSEEEGTRLERLTTLILAVAAEHPASRVPWALSQVELMGTRADLEASAPARLLALAEAIQAFVAPEESEFIARTIGSVTVGAIAAGVGAWIAAGVRRDRLETYVAAALRPALAGFTNLAKDTR
ncbi:TetR/AcrR family transcriptional regulator [Mycetocola sp. JXN-3]|uniref:TetR/AcrR family transcriptional regulator n=1 Tax=Mycetocola sp. JXN-3 TaxID=2116510 RepID=UPI00165D10E0|nr:TetR/AcrR family transcriptional regulator [Mycetocola sp. JXN-3]